MSAVHMAGRGVARGDLVSNAPFRERVEYLQATDPEFSLITVCFRLADEGYPTFLKKPSGTAGGKKMSGDTSHRQRLLGMRSPASSLKKGRRYQYEKRTEFLEYGFACALCRALDAWPVDMGI